MQMVACTGYCVHQHKVHTRYQSSLSVISSVRAQEIANDILTEQTPKRVFQVRGKLYELLVNVVPPEVVLRQLCDELLKKVDDDVKLEVRGSGPLGLRCDSVHARPGVQRQSVQCAGPDCVPCCCSLPRCEADSSWPHRHVGARLRWACMAFCAGGGVGGVLRAPATGGLKGHISPRGVRRAGHVYLQDVGCGGVCVVTLPHAQQPCVPSSTAPRNL